METMVARDIPLFFQSQALSLSCLVLCACGVFGGLFRHGLDDVRKGFGGNGDGRG